MKIKILSFKADYKTVEGGGFYEIEFKFFSIKSYHFLDLKVEKCSFLLQLYKHWEYLI